MKALVRKKALRYIPWVLAVVFFVGCYCLLTGNDYKIFGIRVSEYSEPANNISEFAEPPSCSPYIKANSAGIGKYKPNYGPNVTLEEIENAHPRVETGGRHHPKHCRPLSKMAIIVPVRGRDHHLGVLLDNLHSLLVKQNAGYRVFVIRQTDKSKPFNHGTLNNVGFLEALKLDSFDCFIFHDVDLIPENGDVIYHCSMYPLHLSSYVIKPSWPVPVRSLFGGVVALPRDLFLAANGYSNEYWGWGGEDDDFFYRVSSLGYGILKPADHVGFFRMQRHLNEERNPQREDLLAQWRRRQKRDGVSTAKYEVILQLQHRLFTEIQVRLPPHRN